MSLLRVLPILPLLVAGVLAADSSEQFLTAYQAFQQGEKLERSGNASDALAKYRFAESLLAAISTNDPSWQKPVVEYRLKKTREALDRMNTLPFGGDLVTTSDLPKPKEAQGSGPSITISAPSSRFPGGRDSASASSLRKQIDDLKEQLQEARDAISSQKRRSVDLESAEWIKKRSELANELDVAKRRISDLEHDLKSRSAWAKDLKDLQKKLDDAIADKNASEEQYQRTSGKLSSENAALNGQLREVRERIASGETLNKKVEQLTRELESGKEALGQLRDRLGKSEAEVKSLRASGDQAARRAVVAESDKTALEEEKKRLLAKLEQASVVINVMRTNSLKEAAGIASLRGEADQLRKKLEEKNGDVARANARLADVTRAAMADRAVLEEENSLLSQKLHHASLSIKALVSSAAGLESLGGEVGMLKKRLEEKTSALDLEKNKLTDSERRFSEIQKQKDLLQKNNASLMEQLKSAMASIAASSGQGQEGPAVREQLQRLQQQIDRNAGRYAEAQQHLEELSKARSEQEKTLREREQALEDSRNQALELQTRLTEATRQINDLKKQDPVPGDRVKELQDQLASKDSEILQLRKKAAGPTQDKAPEEEGMLLRGIVLRQLKEEAKRAQARRLMEDELKRLNVQSETLSEQITLLAASSVELTPQEKALFKDAQLVVSGPEESNRLEASISAPKNVASETANAPVPQGGDSQTNSQKTTVDASSAGSPTAELPWKGRFKELLGRAKEEFDRQDYIQAESTFRDALKLSPDDYFALSNLGVVQFQLGKLKEAEETLKKASGKTTDSSFALTTLGIVHYRQDRHDEAEKVLKKSIAVNPQDFTAHNYLGIVLAASGKGKDGESEIMKAIEINPQYADAHFNLAVIYATGKPPAKMMARKHYQKAIELGAPPDASLERIVN